MYDLLLVDDEELVRFSIRHTLEQYVPEITVVAEASDGEEGLSRIRELKPDIVLTDVRMPRRDGLAMIREAKQYRPDMKIIIISGYSDFEYARQAIRYDVSDYVLKPVDGEKLREAILNCIGSTETVRGTEESPAGKVIKYIREHFTEELSLESVASVFGYSPKYLSALIKKEGGENFVSFVQNMRMEKAQELLRQTSLDVKTIAQQIGYEDQHYFNRIFKKVTGRTPSQYRKIAGGGE